MLFLFQIDWHITISQLFQLFLCQIISSMLLFFLLKIIVVKRVSFYLIDYKLKFLIDTTLEDFFFFQNSFGPLQIKVLLGVAVASFMFKQLTINHTLSWLLFIEKKFTHIRYLYRINEAWHLFYYAQLLV